MNKILDGGIFLKRFLSYGGVVLCYGWIIFDFDNVKMVD